MPSPLHVMRSRVRLVAALLLGAMLLGVGQLGLGALQVTAWSAMLVGYTQSTGSVAEAISKTFDGQHPCNLCTEVKELASEQTEPDEAERDQLRMPLALGDARPIVISRPDGILLVAPSPEPLSLTLPVSSPPPRV